MNTHERDSHPQQNKTKNKTKQQVKYILGIPGKRVNTLPQYIQQLVDNISGFQWDVFAVGVSLIILIYLVGYVGKFIKKYATLP